MKFGWTVVFGGLGLLCVFGGCGILHEDSPPPSNSSAQKIDAPVYDATLNFALDVGYQTIFNIEAGPDIPEVEWQDRGDIQIVLHLQGKRMSDLKGYEEEIKRVRPNEWGYSVPESRRICTRVYMEKTLIDISGVCVTGVTIYAPAKAVARKYYKMAPLFRDEIPLVDLKRVFAHASASKEIPLRLIDTFLARRAVDHSGLKVAELGAFLQRVTFEDSTLLTMIQKLKPLISDPENEQDLPSHYFHEEKNWRLAQKLLRQN